MDFSKFASLYLERINSIAKNKSYEVLAHNLALYSLFCIITKNLLASDNYLHLSVLLQIIASNDNGFHLSIMGLPHLAVFRQSRINSSDIRTCKAFIKTNFADIFCAELDSVRLNQSAAQALTSDEFPKLKQEMDKKLFAEFSNMNMQDPTDEPEDDKEDDSDPTVDLKNQINQCREKIAHLYVSDFFDKAMRRSKGNQLEAKELDLDLQIKQREMLIEQLRRKLGGKGQKQADASKKPERSVTIKSSKFSKKDQASKKTKK